MNNLNSILPNEKGFFGNYGGQFIKEELKEEFKKIEKSFLELIKDEDFNNELDYLMKNFVGRPSPIYFAKNLSKKYDNYQNTHIFYHYQKYQNFSFDLQLQ